MTDMTRAPIFVIDNNWTEEEFQIKADKFIHLLIAYYEKKYGYGSKQEDREHVAEMIRNSAPLRYTPYSWGNPDIYLESAK